MRGSEFWICPSLRSADRSDWLPSSSALPMSGSKFAAMSRHRGSCGVRTRCISPSVASQSFLSAAVSAENL